MEAQAAPRRKRKPRPSFKFEREAGCVVCGVDEVGCAPLAGPVVAAAVILPAKGLPRKLAMLINDSKIVPAPKREAAAAALPGYCVIGVGEASVEEIDTLNIYHARMLAMRRAIAGLSTAPGACADRRQRDTEGARLQIANHRRRRCEVPVDRRRVDRGQGLSRCLHA